VGGRKKGYKGQKHADRKAQEPSEEGNDPVIRNSAPKRHITPPPGYQFRQEGRRELLISEGSEAGLRRQGLLNPDGLWEKASRRSHLTGRGEVLVRRGPRGAVAIRRYRHGGLLRSLTGDLFFFGNRPFQELVVTEQARSAGVPTVKILAAVKQKGGWWYRGYLITEYLPAALDLIHYLDQQPLGTKRQKVIEQAAKAVRKIHQKGIYHADLHLKNFLVEEGKRARVFLIDFDKSRRFASLAPSRRMKNLKRLDRSAEKLRRLGLVLTEGDKRRFCHAYARGDHAIRPYLNRFHERYWWHSLVYRWGWRIARVFYPRHRPWRKSIT
jgi:tRNA A-37 threonylcarbamoyl transferase component Bud32